MIAVTQTKHDLRQNNLYYKFQCGKQQPSQGFAMMAAKQ
jgi:hypothetical protein